MHLRFAGYLEIGWSQHFIYSLLLVRYLSGSRRSATYWWYQRVDRLPLLGLLLFISFKHCYWDNSTSLPTVTDVPSKVSFSFISLACKQRACSQAIISYDFSSTVLSNYICYIFCFNITHGDLPSGRRTGWPDPWSMDPSTDRSTDSPQDPPHKRAIIKMTIRDLTYLLFCFDCFFVIVASLTVAMKGGPAYFEKDR